MFYVYLLRSLSLSKKTYIGFTSDVEKRLLAHNWGQSRHTARFKPWKLVVCLQFDSECKARLFEKYLKTNSGRAFAAKHLW